MHPMSRWVLRETGRLEWAQFTDPQDRHRLNEIRKLAFEQLDDDVEAVERDRVGRSWVHTDYDPNGEDLWRRWTPEQMELESGMAVYLARLTDKQRDVLRLLFNGRLTERQAAIVLGVSRAAVQQARDRALATLKRELTAAFIDSEEEDA